LGYGIVHLGGPKGVGHPPGRLGGQPVRSGPGGGTKANDNPQSSMFGGNETEKFFERRHVGGREKKGLKLHVVTSPR